MTTSLAFELADLGIQRAQDGGSGIADSAVNTGDPVTERLQRVYAKYVRFYTEGLAEDQKSTKVRYSSAKVELPNAPDTFVFDGDLDLRLLQVYLLHGWEGVDSVEKRVWEIYSERRGDRQGKLEWAKVARIVRVARNLLALRIRATLLDLEARAQKHLRERLQTCRESLEGVIRDFTLPGTYGEPTNSGAHGGPGSNAGSLRSLIGAWNESRLQQAHEVLQKTFAKTRVVERLRLDLVILDQRITAAGRRQTQRTRGLSGGVLLPSEISETADTQEERSAEQDKAALRPETEDAAESVAELRRQLGDIATPLLMVLPQLKDGFTAADSREAIIQTLDTLDTVQQELSAALAEPRAAVARHLPEPDRALDRIELIYNIDSNLTGMLAKAAYDEFGSDIGQVTLVSESILLSLLDSGQVQRGTFAHAVLVHYLASLVSVTEAARARAARVEAVAAGIAKAAAVSSWAALLASSNPETAAAAPVFRLASQALELPLVMYFAFSTVYRLAQANEAIRQGVAEADFEALESLERVGEIVAFRSGLESQLTQEVLKMIVLGIAQEKVALVKRAVLFFGYFGDLISLLPEGGGDGE